MAMGGTAVLPLAVGAGAIVGAGAGVGYAGYKAVKYFEKKKKEKVNHAAISEKVEHLSRVPDID